MQPFCGNAASPPPFPIPAKPTAIGNPMILCGNQLIADDRQCGRGVPPAGRRGGEVGHRRFSNGRETAFEKSGNTRLMPFVFRDLAQGVPFGQSFRDHTEHLLQRRGLARPDLKLARRLVNEHFHAGDDLGAGGFRQP